MAEKEPLFSCIITCYNRESVIDRAVMSVLRQSFQNFELIVVDDGSADGSVEKVKTFVSDRTHLIQHQANRGQNEALNTGLKKSKGQIIAFLDSDDEWKPTYLYKMAEAYKLNPKIGFAYSDLMNMQTPLEGENKYPEVLRQGYLSTMISITAKKTAINEIGGFNPAYTICQDDDFCFRLSRKFSFKTISPNLAKVHSSSNSMTKNDVANAFGWDMLFRDYKIDILSECGPRTFARHTFKVAGLFIRGGMYGRGYRQYLLGLWHWIRPAKNRFSYPLSEIVEASNYIFGLTFLKLIGKIK